MAVSTTSREQEKKAETCFEAARLKYNDGHTRDHFPCGNVSANMEAAIQAASWALSV